MDKADVLISPPISNIWLHCIHTGLAQSEKKHAVGCTLAPEASEKRQ